MLRCQTIVLQICFWSIVFAMKYAKSWAYYPKEGVITFFLYPNLNKFKQASNNYTHGNMNA